VPGPSPAAARVGGATAGDGILPLMGCAPLVRFLSGAEGKRWCIQRTSRTPSTQITLTVAQSIPPPGHRTAASDMGIFASGDAPSHGSMGAKPLDGPVVGMTSQAAGRRSPTAGTIASHRTRSGGIG
jgi:hypothetical protein